MTEETNLTEENIPSENDSAQANQPSYEELVAKVSELENEKKKFEEIGKKAQHDYIMLKYEFDSLINRLEKTEKELKTSTMIANLKKIIPFVEELRQTIEHTPAEIADNSRTQWIKLVYEKTLKTLETMWVYQIESIGLEPDAELHEPVGVEPTEDPALKWKITKEFERGYILKNGDEKNIIKTAKVIVAQ